MPRLLVVYFYVLYLLEVYIVVFAKHKESKIISAVIAFCIPWFSIWLDSRYKRILRV